MNFKFYKIIILFFILFITGIFIIIISGFWSLSYAEAASTYVCYDNYACIYNLSSQEQAEQKCDGVLSEPYVIVSGKCPSQITTKVNYSDVSKAWETKYGLTYHCICSDPKTNNANNKICKEFKYIKDSEIPSTCYLVKGCEKIIPLKGDCPSNYNKVDLSAKSIEELRSLATILNKPGYSSPKDVITVGIKLMLGTIGVVTLALYLWAGFLWATSQGNAEKTGKAVQILVWTTLGVVVMLSSYLLVNYIFTAVIN